MYYLNKIVYGFLNPLSLALAMMAAAVVLALVFECKKGTRARKLALGLGIFSIAWLYFFSTGVSIRATGLPLEKAYHPIEMAEDMPSADAIVVLGGGISAITNDLRYAELEIAADRVWHAARLYHQGKAPIVVPCGSAEMRAARPLLIDLGVKEDAIVVEDESRNTE